MKQANCTNRSRAAATTAWLVLLASGILLGSLIGVSSGAGAQDNGTLHSGAASAASLADPITVMFKKNESPQPSYAAVADTYIDSMTPARNAGVEVSLKTNPNNDGRERILIKFDVASIPATAQVERAELYLFAWYRSQSYGILSTAYQVRRFWKEREATWNVAYTGSPWGVGGASDTVLDIYPTRFATATLGYTNQYYRWDVTQMARDWVSDPAANHGVMIRTGPGATQYQFRPSEHTAANQRPYLVVTYYATPTSPTASATPSVTPTSTQSPTPVNSPTPTQTLPPTQTPTPTLTLTPSGPTSTPTNTPTSTPTPTPGLWIFQRDVLPSDSYTGVQDTTINSFRPSLTQGSGDSLTVSNRLGGSDRVLVRFELEGHIPSGIPIKSARLSLHAWSRRTLFGLRVSAFEVNRGWLEESATWAMPMLGSYWGGPGADAVPDDRLGIPASSRFVYLTNMTYEWDVTEAVQRWVNDPSSNHGIILVGHDSDQEIRFRSSEYGVTIQRPKLTVVN